MNMPNHIRKGAPLLLCILALWVWFWYLSPLPRLAAPSSTVVVDRQGELLGARIASDGQWRFPVCDEVPEKFARCLVEFEDRRFYLHPGVDPLAASRAVRQNIRSGKVVSGGSTITMQLVRIMRQRPRTISEKITEALLAMRLELRMSKRQIMALYASYAPMGGNVVGIDAASWRYFGHPADRLSWGEAATLAVLPNAPSMLHLSRNREALRGKRDRLLKRLYDRGVIDNSDYLLALDEELPGEPLPLPTLAPHLVSLMAQDHGGKYCNTTIDGGLQAAVEGTLGRWSAEFVRSDIRNAAAVVLDVASGEVLAYSGNVNFASGASANQVDVVRARRSSGSILKPLLYCAMMQGGDILPRTLMADVPVNINGFAPRNFNVQYDGAVPAAEAVARSLNVPAVGMLRAYGIPKFYDFLKNTGFTTLDRPASHYGLSMILGGAEVTLMDVSAAYMNLARTTEGVSATRPAVMQSGKTSVESVPYGAGAAWLTMEAIKEVNRPEEIDWRVIPSMQTIGWKTGTSYGLRDGWAVGVTPRYVVGVWVGNSNGEGKAGLTGAATAGPVMFDIFNLLAAGEWFRCPGDDLVEAAVCPQSGHLAGRFCNSADTVLICAAGRRTAPCPYHIEVMTTADGSRRVTVDTPVDPANPPVVQSWFVLPAAQEWYYRQRHPSYLPLPPMASDGQDDRAPIQFIYPQPGSRITMPLSHDGTPQPIVLRAAHSYADATLYWHLDEQYIGQTTLFHTMPVTPAAGQHTVTVVDEGGSAVYVRFRVE